MAEQQTIECPHCGKPNRPQQTFCGYCSKELHPKTENLPACQPNPMPISPEKKVKPTKQTAKQIIESLQQDTKQLRVDLTELQGRYITLENAYLSEHRGLTPRTSKILTWVAVICTLALIVALYFFFRSQSNLPPEISNLL